MANLLLRKEFEHYLAHQSEIVKQYDGKYVVIVNGEVVGNYDSALTAVNESKKKHELGTFLVQLVSAGNEAYTQRFHSRVAFSCLVFIIVALFSTVNIYAENAGSFTTAKRWAESIYSDHRTSFYCQCTYSAGKVVDKASCGYSPRRPFTRSGKGNKRANRIEWEHVLPASLMGQQLACWGPQRGEYKQCLKSNGKLKSGRDCCLKVNDTFRRAHNDLVGLVPAVGELNADRSNYRYGLIEGEPRKYGACDFEVENRIAEPPEEVRGDIARIQFYLLNTYGQELGFSFDETRLTMLRKWDVEDPVADWERQRNRRICAKQGAGNSLVGSCDEI